MITFLLAVIVLQLFWIGGAVVKLNNNFVKWTRFHQAITPPWKHEMKNRKWNV